MDLTELTDAQLRGFASNLQASGDPDAQAYLATVQQEQQRRKLATEMSHPPRKPSMESLTGESLPRTLVREVGQAALFGLTDEVTGAVVALATRFSDNPALHSIPMGEVYADVRDAERDARRTAQAAAPYAEGPVQGAMAISQVGGALGSGLGTAKLLMGLPGIASLGAVPQAAFVGGIEGGLAGFGGSEANTPGGVALDTAGGTALGMGLGMAAAGGAALGSWGLEKVKNLFLPGTHNVDQQAREVLMAQLDEAGSTVAEMLEWMKKNPEASLAAYGPFQRVARAHIASSPAGTDIAEAAYKRTLEQQRTQLLRVAGEVMGDPQAAAQNFKHLREQYAAGAKAQARPFYDDLYQQPSPAPPGSELRDLLDHPGLKRYVSEAGAEWEQDITATTALSLRPKPGATDLSDMKNWEWASDPTWKELDMVQRKMRADAETLRKAINSGNAEGGKVSRLQALENNRRELLATMYRSGDAGAALQTMHRTYATAMDVDHHFGLGARLFKQGSKDLDSEELADLVGQMNPQELKAFQLGSLKAMRDGLANMGQNRNASLTPIFNTPEARKRLEVVFGSASQDLFEEIDRLRKLTGNAGRVSPGAITSTSDTLNSLQAGENMLASGGLLGAMQDWTRGTAPLKNAQVRATLAEQLYGKLSSHDPTAMARFFDQNQNVMQQMGGAAARAMPQSPGMWGGLGGAGATLWGTSPDEPPRPQR